MFILDLSVVSKENKKKKLLCRYTFVWQSEIYLVLGKVGIRAVGQRR